MSTPMVSAAAALLFQKDPSLNPATVKARLMKSAVKDDRLVFETGAGYLDVAAALLATGVAKDAPSPAAMLALDGYIYLQDTGFIWGPDFTMGGIWGGGKGASAGISMTDVPPAITSSYGGVWGGKGGAKAIVDNTLITSSGLLWTGDRCLLESTLGMVDNMGGIWGGKKP